MSSDDGFRSVLRDATLPRPQQRAPGPVAQSNYNNQNMVDVPSGTSLWPESSMASTDFGPTSELQIPDMGQFWLWETGPVPDGAPTWNSVSYDL